MKNASLYAKVAFAFLATFVLGACLIQLNERNQVLQNQRAAMDVAAMHGHLLQEQIDRSLSATYALAAVLRQGQGKIDNFDALAREMLPLYGGTSALQLAPRGIISDIVPLRGNEAAIGHNLLADPKRNKEAFAAVQTKKLTLAGPFTLRQGGVAVIGRLPIFMANGGGEEQFWGFTIALIRIADLLVASKLDGLAASDYEYELWRIHPDNGQKDIFARSSPAPLHEPVSYRVTVPNGEWTLSLARVGGWHSSWTTLGIEVAAVLITSLLAGLLAYHLLKQPQVLRREVELRTQALMEANFKLAAEVFERQQAEQALRESEEQLERRVEERTAQLAAANEALQEQQERQKALLDNIEHLQHKNQLILDSLGEGVYGIDIDGCFTFANPALEKMLGWTAGELIGRPSHATLHHSRQDGSPYPVEDCPLYLACLSGEARSADDEVFWRRDGTSFLVEYTTNPIREGGRIVGAVVVLRDVSQRKQTEQQLQRNYDELKRMHQELEATQSQLLQSEKMASIGQLAAGIAHEINNPIGFVNSNLGSLQRYVDDLLSLVDAYGRAEALLPAPAVREVAEVKERSDFAYLKEDVMALLRESLDGVTRVRGIVQDLKDFSHVGENDWQQADLNRGLDSTLNVVWNELKYKAEVVKEYGDLPPVECMASQLNQVFMNLLVNAAQAIEQRGTITIRTGAREESVWVEIADTGKGIAPEHLPRIFEPFFTTKPVGKGTGLGLSISYGIVQKHGGRIEVESEEGKGTAFRVTLPIHPPVEREASQEKTTAEA